MRGAIQTIIIADAVMGIDNVLAVGGAAQGSMLLVVIGLAVSIPIVIWGSTLVLQWVERFPAILWLGAAVLGWTAAKMIASEPLIRPWLDAHTPVRTALYRRDRRRPDCHSDVADRGQPQPARVLRAVLVLLAVWLTCLGLGRGRARASHFDGIDDWHWDNEIVDLDALDRVDSDRDLWLQSSR